MILSGVFFRSRVWLISLCMVLTSCGQSPFARIPMETATPAATATAVGISVIPLSAYQPDADCPAKVREMRAKAGPDQPLYERYKDLRVIDIHNHGTSGDALRAIRLHEKYFVDGIVLFGNISEPSAIDTDRLAFQMYSKQPGLIYPFFSGIPLEDVGGVTMARDNLEKGYFGIREIVGASTFSPMTKNLLWKADHPNSGSLPEIYKLSAQYHAPVLLHIDPPEGKPIEELETALEANQQAILIFGHANAYNAPGNIERLVASHPNLYIDFFAGFTKYSQGSTNTLADFVPMIEKYPDRFMVSTDSGYEVGESRAIWATYDLLDLLTPETACKVAHQNFDSIIETQPPTETQIAMIVALSIKVGLEGDRRLNRRMASELIFELQGK